MAATSNTALAINLTADGSAEKAVGASATIGTSGISGAVADATAPAKKSDELVGRKMSLDNVKAAKGAKSTAHGICLAHAIVVMRYAAALIAGLVGYHGMVAAQESRPAPPQPAFRSGVDLVTLHVTVTDQSGKYVTDIKPADVVVRENGRPQELSLFQPGGLPLSVALLLDTSASVRADFPEVQDAAVRFLRQLQPHDRASVIAFGDTVRVLHEFTTNRDDLERAVRQAVADGTTTLYNAVYVALNQLDSAAEDGDGNIPSRRVVVVFSDGDDTSSVVGFADVLDSATRNDAAIYAIRLGLDDGDGEEHAKAGFALRELAKHTGGRAFFPQTSYELPYVYEDIRLELSQQYALGFVSSEPPGDRQFRRLSVQILRPGAQARTKRGYVAPTRSRRMR